MHGSRAQRSSWEMSHLRKRITAANICNGPAATLPSCFLLLAFKFHCLTSSLYWKPPRSQFARHHHFPPRLVAMSDCPTNNEFNGRLGVRVSSIFVILIGSFLGTWFPVFAARHRGVGVPSWMFFVAKFFGSGVIIATAFIHVRCFSDTF